MLEEKSKDILVDENDVIYNEVLKSSPTCRKIHNAIMNNEDLTLSNAEVQMIRRAVFQDEAQELILNSICFSKVFGKFR